MKKNLGILVCFCFMLQFFWFASPVFANENVEIEIVSIKQDGKQLEERDGVYQAISHNGIDLSFRVKNVDNTNDYYMRTLFDYYSFEYGFGYISWGDIPGSKVDNDESIKTVSLYLDEDYEISQFKLGVGEKYVNNGIIKTFAEKDFKIKVNAPNVYVTGISQGGKNIIPTQNEYNNFYSFKVNSKEDIVLTLKGDNLYDNATYTFVSGDYRNKYNFTGSALKNGVDITIPQSNQNKESYYSYTPDIILSTGCYENIHIHEYKNEGSLYEFDFDYFDDESIPNFEWNLSYTNFKTKEIKDVINSKYHNKDNSLSININGNNYEDKDYPVTVIVSDKDGQYYKKELNINGLLLNDGYYLELSNLLLEIPKYDPFDSYYGYKFSVKVDQITKWSLDTYYYTSLCDSLEKAPKVYNDLFLENGKQLLDNSGLGDTSFYDLYNFYEISRDVYKAHKTYLRFYSKNMNDDDNYSYKLIYTKNNDYSNAITIATGNVKGKDLNKQGLFLEINNINNYSSADYHFVIEKDNDLVYHIHSQISFLNVPTFVNVFLQANNKNIYMQTYAGMHAYSYYATRNFPQKITLYGIAFEDNKNYDIVMCSRAYKESSEGEGQIDYSNYDEKCETYTFSGKKLNNGTASINWNEKYGKEIIKLEFEYKCYENGNRDDMVHSSRFNIDFVESKDYFPEDNPYKIDNAKDIIKNIGKKTKTSDFESSVDITNNGHIKIYDKTGAIEQKDYVGTGMIARISDENNHSLLDMDIVVKGDTTGDGNVSITDLVQVKQHLANTKKLSGVYEMAADVTDTGDVSITDLVKVSRDVAGIEVLK